MTTPTIKIVGMRALGAYDGEHGTTVAPVECCEDSASSRALREAWLVGYSRGVKNMHTEPCSENYQRGWNDAHRDVTVEGLWHSSVKIEAINPAPDYVEGYLESQENLLEERAAARQNAPDQATASEKLRIENQ